MLVTYEQYNISINMLLSKSIANFIDYILSSETRILITWRVAVYLMEIVRAILIARSARFMQSAVQWMRINYGQNNQNDFMKAL